MLKEEVLSKYQVVSYDEHLDRLIREAEEDLGDIEKELQKKREEYRKLIEDENASLEDLVKFEDEIEQLENEREKSAENYQNALSTTIEDLKADERYDRWKAERE